VPAQSPSESGTRLAGYRPGLAADAARALMAAKAEEVAHVTEPDTAYRAADLAARVASLVSRISEPAAPSEPASWSPDGGRTAPEQDRDSFYPGARPAEQDRDTYPGPRHAESRTAADVERFEAPTPNLATRAEAVRRTAARMAANSARNRGGTRRADREPGVSTPGDRTS
jgi:hypothetical protein